jgi:S-adenosyl-L-methionine hydrolase (adenosine-forming)
MRSGILTLTTDFGPDGPYVASIKGIILGLAPGTHIVDVSHCVPPQDIAHASFLLGQIVESFPQGTVHLAVVDPGVGTDRRLIVVEACEQLFTLPDNGLIGGVLNRFEPAGTWEIRNPRLRRAVVSSTFHGRDILAPVAAHLLRGGDPADVGPRLEGPFLPTMPESVEGQGRVAGEVVFVDSFGNLITNIQRRRLERIDLEVSVDWVIEVLGQRIEGISTTYGNHSPGTLLALIGSSGRLEIAVVNGNAATLLGAVRGTPVAVRPLGGAGT